MTQPSGDEGDDSYEAVLVREDRRNVRISLIIGTVLGLTTSSWFDAVFALVVLAPLLLFNTAMNGWNARRMIRMGYVVRGKAMIGSAWRMLAVSLVLAVIFWVQARYGLWFAQYLADGFY